MTSVKRSASCGATRCHITWVSEKPCSNSSGGPLPPTRAKMRPDVVLIHSEAKPGNRSARSGIVAHSTLDPFATLFQRLLLLDRLPADIAAAKSLRPLDPVDRGIGALPRFHYRLARGANVEHAAAIGEKCAVFGDRAGLEDFDALDLRRFIQPLDAGSLGVIAGISLRGHHDRQSGFVEPAQIEVLQFAVAGGQ